MLVVPRVSFIFVRSTLSSQRRGKRVGRWGCLWRSLRAAAPASSSAARNFGVVSVGPSSTSSVASSAAFGRARREQHDNTEQDKKHDANLMSPHRWCSSPISLATIASVPFSFPPGASSSAPSRCRRVLFVRAGIFRSMTVKQSLALDFSLGFHTPLEMPMVTNRASFFFRGDDNVDLVDEWMDGMDGGFQANPKIPMMTTTVKIIICQKMNN